jgi:hypothetical protein
MLSIWVTGGFDLACDQFPHSSTPRVKCCRYSSSVWLGLDRFSRLIHSRLNPSLLGKYYQNVFIDVRSYRILTWFQIPRRYGRPCILRPKCERHSAPRIQRHFVCCSNSCALQSTYHLARNFSVHSPGPTRRDPRCRSSTVRRYPWCWRGNSILRASHLSVESSKLKDTT